MELKMDSTQRVSIRTNIANLKQNGLQHSYKVTDSKLGQFVKIHGNKIYLKNLQQIEDKYIGYGKYTSQFYFEQ